MNGFAKKVALAVAATAALAAHAPLIRAQSPLSSHAATGTFPLPANAEAAVELSPLEGCVWIAPSNLGIAMSGDGTEDLVIDRVEKPSAN